ncbi:MFS transporter [Candidatus Nitrosacidococcus tergens]|uniref:Putative transporter n=1 Tax=Candidatus Nitrosacidococcus tergens TaxID=553981 RepID=A0A7G1QA37_9GAMM|nr:MFS transporter [Candidatus Nitrosacidococcus tergens]CAB1276388.1 putative transporter [Candidatus Nitrosacidococcus tergens]
MINNPTNSLGRILFASMVGTTIEFFDFYIYATAAVLVFPKLFFPASDPTSGVLQSLATFALAFFARPLGSGLFGHFGDRIGRKATLVAALLTMGICTVLIGMLPTYEQIGIFSPLLLALCRFGQGLGLGGEWGGAVLLATEHAPLGKRAWYGMFPQLGAPIGFIAASGIFLVLSALLTDDQFFSWGWRIPFVASAGLVIIGLWVRLKITETPVFQKTLDKEGRVQVPMVSVFRYHTRALILGTVISLATFVLFYLVTVFALTWGTTQLGYSREQFLLMQIFAVIFFGATIPLSALHADKHGRRHALLWISGIIAIFGMLFAHLFSTGIWGVLLGLVIGLSLMGYTYGPLGTVLSELYPTHVRYTGTSLSFNLSGIFGASLAPYIATWLATHYGLQFVGYYLSIAALLSFIATLMIGETKDIDLA